jgi:hypothetical protein
VATVTKYRCDFCKREVEDTYLESRAASIFSSGVWCFRYIEMVYTWCMIRNVSNHYCREYNDNCDGCQPAIADPRTGQKLADDSSEMVAVRAFWKTVALNDKKACHRVWCFNSRTTADMEAVQRVGQGMEAAFRSLDNARN